MFAGISAIVEDCYIIRFGGVELVKSITGWVVVNPKGVVAWKKLSYLFHIYIFSSLSSSYWFAGEMKEGKVFSEECGIPFELYLYALQYIVVDCFEDI